MADTLSTTSSLDNLLPSYLEKRMIARLVPVERFYQFGEKRPLPKGQGTTMTFNGWTNLAAASSTLTEGTPNSLVALSSRKVTATIAQYGRGVKVTDLAGITTITDVIRGAVDILSTSAALSLDNVCQLAIFKNVIAQVGTNADTKAKILSAWMSTLASAFSANTGTDNNSNQFGLPFVFGASVSRLSAVNKAAPTASARMSRYSIAKTVDAIRSLDGLPMADGFFTGIAHPKALTTLRRDVTWQDWNKYLHSKETMYKGEVGEVEGVRFVQSTNVPRYAVAAHSVNLSVIFGQNCYAVTQLDGGIKMMVKNPGPSSTDNPFDSYSTIAYKLNAVAAVINPSAGRILATHEKI